ncbi:MAG: hypothetical protein ABIQ00_20345 [Chitinophagaceae bacterium]
MRRIHAFEFGDLTWFPGKLRNYQTDFLQFAADTFDLYECLLPIIKKGIESSTGNTIVDIASGSGGGLLKVAEHLTKGIPHLKIILSDYYPNTDAFKRTKAKQPNVFQYEEAPVNAMDVPKYLNGFRTQFLSFHHFKPKDAKAILQNAIESNQPIGIFEAHQRDLKNIVRMLFSPIAVLLMTPLIKPFEIERIIFTYLIPVLPLLTLWDGVVSVLRTYTIRELKQMIYELRDNELFDWEVDVAKGKQNEILYLLGTPVKLKISWKM